MLCKTLSDTDTDGQMEELEARWIINSNAVQYSTVPGAGAAPPTRGSGPACRDTSRSRSGVAGSRPAEKWRYRVDTV